MTLDIRVKRPKLVYMDGVVSHVIYGEAGITTEEARIVFRRDLISVGCMDIEPEAAALIMEEWNKRFGPAAKRESVILQRGCHGT